MSRALEIFYSFTKEIFFSRVAANFQVQNSERYNPSTIIGFLHLLTRILAHNLQNESKKRKKT